jgi:quinol monooxygenase YgiN
MTTPTLHVVARIVAQAEQDAALRLVLLELVDQTRRSPLTCREMPCNLPWPGANRC